MAEQSAGEKRRYNARTNAIGRQAKATASVAREAGRQADAFERMAAILERIEEKVDAPKESVEHLHMLSWEGAA
jgi:hypothetical protein